MSVVEKRFFPRARLWVAVLGLILAAILGYGYTEGLNVARVAGHRGELLPMVSGPTAGVAPLPSLASSGSASPSERVEASEEVPDEYRGAMVVAGRVLGQDSQPVLGAVVVVEPGGFMATSEVVRSHYRASTDARGRFEIRELPRVANLIVRARKGELTGPAVRVARPEREVVLRLRRTRYARILVTDDAGVPIRIRGLGLPITLFSDSIEYCSLLPLDAGSARELRQSVAADHTLADNEALMLLRVGVRDFPWRVEIPGYEPRDVQIRMLPYDSWPAAQSLVLRRVENEDRILYRLMLPEVRWPHELAGVRGSLPGLTVAAQYQERGVTMTVPFTREQTRWASPVRHQLVVNLGGDLMLSHEERELEGETVISPHYPAFGFMDLRFDQSMLPPDEFADAWTFWAVRGESQFAGVRLYRGRVVLGPLPVGTYQVIGAHTRLQQPTIPCGSYVVREGHVTHAVWR